jgi:ABC-type uncharacterized transport system involved in gliding motility auxiliary subunit
MERKAQAATETGVYIAIIAAILVVVNIIAFAGVHKRFDLTRNERYTLTQGSARLIRTLKGPIQIDAYVTKGLPKLDAFVRDLTDLLKLYQQKGGSNFEYTIIEAKSDEQRTAAKEAGLQDMAFGEGSETGEDQATITQGYMGLVFKYGSEKDVIPAVSPDRADGLEFWITNKIRTIRDKADSITHKIGVITGKDEIKLSDTHLVPAQGRQGGPSMRAIIERNFPFYKFEDVDLKSGETEIDKELDGLIITQPDKDYTDKELRRIDQFVMLGNKALAVFASAVNVKVSDGTMTATLSTRGLEKLLSGYGIEMKKDAVFDTASSMQFPMITQTGVPVWLRYPSILQVHHDSRWDDEHQMLDDSFPVFFRARELVFPFSSSLVQHPDKQPEAKMSVLARTSDRASVETSDSVVLKASSTWKPKPPVGQKAIAISVQGTIKAAMGAGDGIDVPAASKEKSRVLVIASSQFLTNPFARAGAGQDLGGQYGAMMGPVGGDEQLQAIAEPYAQRFLNPAIVCLKNALDWLSGDSDLIAASAKIFGDPNLAYSDIAAPKIEAGDNEESLKKKEQTFRDARKNAQRNIQLTLSLLCPALFAGFGIYRWRRREGKRANITLD